MVNLANLNEWNAKHGDAGLKISMVGRQDAYRITMTLNERIYDYHITGLHLPYMVDILNNMYRKLKESEFLDKLVDGIIKTMLM